MTTEQLRQLLLNGFAIFTMCFGIFLISCGCFNLKGIILAKVNEEKIPKLDLYIKGKRILYFIVGLIMVVSVIIWLLGIIENTYVAITYCVATLILQIGNYFVTKNALKVISKDEVLEK